jgi:hypothetical protein
MADNRYKQVQAFNAPTAYDQQMVEARRRRRMAEALANQAYTPQDVGVAPIPAAAPLVQGLQAFLSARAARKADEAEEKAAAEVTRTGEQIAGRLAGGAPVRSLAPADASGLQEVAVTSEYQRSPEDALRVAMTSPGTAAVKGNPMLAAMLARTMEKPSQMEVGAVNLGDLTPESAKRFARSRNPEDIEYRAPEAKPEQLSNISRLLKEFNDLPEGDPRRSVLRAAIDRETRPPSGPSVNIRYSSPIVGVDDSGNPVFFQSSPTGGPPSVVQGVRPPSKDVAPRVEEAQTGWNITRIVNAANAIQGAIGKDPNAIKPGAREFAAGAFGDEAANAVRSPQRQIVVGEQADMVDALITLATGAAYTQEQLIAARRGYLPTLTDSPEAIQRKTQKLIGLIPAAKARAGAAWTPELDKAAETLTNSLKPPASPGMLVPSGGWGKAQQVR